VLLREHRPKRATCLALVAASVLAACAGPGDPKTGIDRLEADLVFGLKPPSEAAPSAFTPPALTESGEEEFLDVPESLPTPTPTPSLRPRPRRELPNQNTPPAQTCPEAALTAFPAKPADIYVTEKPKEGLTRWRRSGTRTINGQVIPVAGFERRVLRRVQDDNGAFSPTATQPKMAYTFETIRPIDGGAFEVTQYRVNTAPVSTTTASDHTGGPTSPDPEAGVVMKRVDIVRADGTTTPSFEPVRGLLLLPLPVTPGASFSSTATDARNERVFTIEGRIVGRGRVDACGDIIDGWRVEATMTQRSLQRGEEVVKYNYLVATQYGGVMIAESAEGQVVGDTNESYSVSFQRAQLEPDPLPESLR
jgi:hypothetical protein